MTTTSNDTPLSLTTADDLLSSNHDTSDISYTGAELYVAGLSPTYLAHVPLLIAQIHTSIHLIHGLHCLKTTHNPEQWFPLSCCRLTGTIVSVERKQQTIVYVLDDGTGWIDVVVWIKESLPSLTIVPEDEDVFPVGEMVRVLGRIQTCAVLKHDETDDNSHKSYIREIHASQITVLKFNAEIQHWMSCATEQSSFLFNVNDVLHHLGSDIAQQVARREQLPAANGDDLGAWRLFGTQCRCQLPYKQTLLYCHCIATRERLDPNFCFRDAVLSRLLEMEEEAVAQNNINNKMAIENHLRFQYKTLATDDSLMAVARKVIADHTLEHNINTHNDFCINASTFSCQPQHLLEKTIYALRTDGILYLLDEDLDTYVLISPNQVLIPYYKIMLSKSMDFVDERVYFKTYRPSYLSNVPKAKLELVRRMIINSKIQTAEAKI